MAYNILIIEPDPAHRESLKRYLVGKGYRIHTEQSSQDGLRAFDTFKPDLALINAVLSDGDGFSVVRRMLEYNRNFPVIMISDFGTVDSAVQAMKMGVVDYLVKPLDYSRLSAVIRKGLMKSQQEVRRSSIQKQRRERFHFSNLVGTSPVFLKITALVKKIAESPANTVLIQGESGTGKELAAKAIHYNSNRYQKTFVEINCAAIPEGLLEAELFGHEKGAFTGAVREKKGLFEVAEGGSVFLDEIGHMPLSLQIKLNKVIDERVFRRVGGTKEIELNSRIIAATHLDLLQAVRNGTFRQDLYYRLNVIHLTMPSLRERGPEDILLLIRHFIDVFNHSYMKNIRGLSPQAEQLVLSYSWPGNVRQLRNAVERAVILNDGEIIEPEHLQLDAEHSAAADSSTVPDIEIPDTGLNIDDLINRLLVKAYEKAGGNKTRAAKYLGMTRESFKYRWKKISSGDKKSESRNE